MALAGCRSTDDARMLQVLNQRGFGRPTQDANRQYYLGIGDTVVMRDPNHPEYNGVVEAVRMDGVVTLPDVGPVYVNGLTPQEASQVVQMRYEDYITDTTGITIEVTGIQSKVYYVTAAPPRKPQWVRFEGDVTLIDALIRANISEPLIDTEAVLVMRGDPVNPLVIACNYENIKRKGLTRDNIMIRENDIIYLQPSVVGYIAWGVDVMLAPLTPIKEFIFGTSSVLSATSTFGKTGTGNKNFNNNFNNF